SEPAPLAIPSPRPAGRVCDEGVRGGEAGAGSCAAGGAGAGSGGAARSERVLGAGGVSDQPR
ncbi:hypothetical protein ACG5V6_27515, partial [Streptomyces chitinivorans]